MAQKNKGEKLRVAVVGLGIGDKHARGVLRHSGAELVAVCDADPSKGAALVKLMQEEGVDSSKPSFVTGPNAFDDLMKWGQFDAATVALPNFMHRATVERLLAAGKHVLCEKPMAHTLEDALAMKAAADACPNLVSAMVTNNNFRPDVALFADQTLPIIGRPYEWSGWWTRPRGIPFRGRWFGNKALSGGGPVVDLGPHIIALLMHLTNWVPIVSVQGWTWSVRDAMLGAWDGPYGGGATGTDVFDVETAAKALLVLESGAIADLELAWGKPVFHEMMGLSVTGDVGSATINRNWFTNDGDDTKARDGIMMCRNQRVGKGKSAKWVMNHTEINGDNSPNFTDPWMGRLTNVQAFIDCIRGEKVPALATFDRGIVIQKVIDAIYCSAEDGGAVIRLAG